MNNPTARPLVKSTTNLTREELEMQFIELFNSASSYGYSWSKKVSMQEFIKMLDDGAIDHQEAAHKAMRLIDTYTQAKEREAKIAENRYHWHRQKQIEKGPVSTYFLARNEELAAQQADKENP